MARHPDAPTFCPNRPCLPIRQSFTAIKRGPPICETVPSAAASSQGGTFNKKTILSLIHLPPARIKRQQHPVSRVGSDPPRPAENPPAAACNSAACPYDARRSGWSASHKVPAPPGGIPGGWRSWLAHQHDTLGVTGSSPVPPIAAIFEVFPCDSLPSTSLLRPAEAVALVFFHF